MNEPQSERIGRLMRELASELTKAFPNHAVLLDFDNFGNIPSWMLNLYDDHQRYARQTDGDPVALIAAAMDAVAKEETAKLTSNVKSSKAEVFSPAEYLRDELEARGWTIDDLAAKADLPPDVARGLTRGTWSVNRHIAEKLGAAFGTSADLWMNLQGAREKESK